MYFTRVDFSLKIAANLLRKPLDPTVRPGGMAPRRKIKNGGPEIIKSRLVNAVGAAVFAKLPSLNFAEL